MRGCKRVFRAAWFGALGAVFVLAVHLGLLAPVLEAQSFLPSATKQGLDLDFENNRYWQDGPSISSTVASFVTVSRASTAYQDDLSGVYTSFGNNVVRQTNKGTLIEEARTNSVLNNSMQGAVAGSPGTLPTGWQALNVPTGLTRTISLNTISGADCIDIELAGTTSSSAQILVYIGASTAIAASYGQTLTASLLFQQLLSDANVGGSGITIQENNSGGTQIAAGGGSVFSDASLTRRSHTRTLTNSATAFARELLTTGTVGSGLAIDWKVRICWPQLENNGINATVASATANSDGSGYGNTLTGTMTWAGSGCTTNPVLNVTSNAGGAIVTVNSVPTPGSCTTFPPAGATTWTPGGGLSAGTLATFNLVPTNNAAQGFATSPIRTTNAAATRAADTVTATNSLVFRNGYTLFFKGTPLAPLTYPLNQGMLSIDDTSNVNRLQIVRNLTTGLISYVTASANVIGDNVNSALAPATGASGKVAVAATPGSTGMSFNGAAVVGGTSSSVAAGTTLTRIDIGNQAGQNRPFNGYVERVAIVPAARLTDPQLRQWATP